MSSMLVGSYISVAGSSPAYSPVPSAASKQLCKGWQFANLFLLRDACFL